MIVSKGMKIKLTALVSFASKGEHLLVCFGVITVLNAFVRLLFSSALENDQAEQVILAQNISPGYFLHGGSQPPLYTYLSIIAFRVLGHNSAALALLKIAIMLGFFVVYWSIGERLGLSSKQQSFSLISLGLIPQVAWEAQRDLTHSLLLLLFSSLFLLELLKLRESRNPVSYIKIGFYLALGFLSKYIFLIFALSFIISMLALRPYRIVLLSRWSLLSLSVAVLVVLPNVLWAYDYYMHASLSVAGKIQSSGVANAWSFANPILCLFAFFGPSLIGVWIVLRSIHFRRARRFGGDFPPLSDRDPTISLLLAASVCTVGLAILCSVLSGATSFRDRWYLGLLFYVPIVLGYYSSLLDIKSFSRYILFGVVVIVFSVFALNMRTFYPSAFGSGIEPPGYPVAAIARQIKGALGRPDVIISDNVVLPGSLSLLLPGSRVDLYGKDYVARLVSGCPGRCQIVILSESRERDLDVMVRDLVKGGLSIGSGFSRGHFSAPVHHDASKTYSVKYLGAEFVGVASR